ncbi:MAG TPA: MBL fold metallo-hydrolase [Candidatus Saccharimonadales bacterium]
MKITKFVHSCLLVEMPAPVNRTALFDPGVMSEAALDVDALEFLDNIIITHSHVDHMSLPLLQKLRAKFPSAQITAPPEARMLLAEQGIESVSEETPGIAFFASPHADVSPLFPTPQQAGVHYLDTLTNPGDGYDFSETKAILALPITAPWGATTDAVRTALKLKPQYIIPIHDWHWSDDARTQTYDNLEPFFADHDIKFIKPITGQPFVIDISIN